MTDNDNVTPIRPDGDEPLTVADLRRQLAERQGPALVETERRLASLSVARVRRDAAAELSTHARRIDDLQGDLVAGYGRFTGSDDDPLAALGREVREVVALYGVLEALAGRGARRPRQGEQ